MLKHLPSVLWHCWLGVRKSIRPVKNWVMRCWCGYLSGARCRLFAYGPADATAIPKPQCLLPHLNPDWFYLSGTGLPRLSWVFCRVVLSTNACFASGTMTVEYKMSRLDWLWKFLLVTNAEYCDQYVCVSTCVSQKPDVQTSQYYQYTLTVAAAGLLLMTMQNALCTSSFVDGIMLQQ